jgi:hypothetical protein
MSPELSDHIDLKLLFREKSKLSLGVSPSNPLIFWQLHLILV